MKGLFIVIEGVECSGKSTQAHMLLDFCVSRNIPARLVREPGSTVFGEKIRDIILTEDCSPLAEFLAFSASRAQLVETEILPALDKGDIVICDRYFYSSLVYQGCAKGLDMSSLQAISVLATHNLVPNFAFLLDPNFEVAYARLAAKKGHDRIEASGETFHKKVYEGYRSMPTLYPYMITLDGSLSPDAVHKNILSCLAEKYPCFYS